MLVLPVALVARAESVSLSVAPQTRCLNEDSLRAALGRAGLELVESGGLDVDVSESGEGVRLRARRVRDARLLVRTVPLRNGCGGLELALVTLIREWASAPELGSVASPSDGTSAPTPAASTTVARPVATRPKVNGARPPAPDANAASSSAANTSSVSPDPVRPADSASVERETVPLDEVLANSHEPSLTLAAPADQEFTDDGSVGWEVRGAFGGGVSSVISTSVTPLGVLTADVGRGLFGASLDGAFDGNVTLSSAPGLLVFSTQSLTLAARVRVGWDRLHFDLGVGVRGFRITAASSGFSVNGSTAQLSVGPAVLATAWVRLIGPLLLMLRGSGALRFPADQFVVTGGPTFTVGSAQVGVVLGLSIAWP
jgi:hypothetical protein